MGLSAEEIAKVKEEWEERQKRKLEKEKAKQKEEDSKKDKSESEDKKADKETTTEPKAEASAPTTPAPSHQRFTLHRDFFAMRLAEHRKRRQMAQVRELAPRLPGAPNGGLPNPS